VGKPLYAGGGEVAMSARVSPVLDGAGTWVSALSTGSVPWFQGNVDGSSGSCEYRNEGEHEIMHESATKTKKHARKS
jgi:hypothetical protein